MTTTHNHTVASKKTQHPSSAVLRPSQSAAFASAIQALRAIEAGFELITDVDPAEREVLARKVRYMPDTVLEGVASVAAEHGGRLADVALSADQVRETIARSAASTSLVRALRAFAQRVENDALSRKSAVVDQVSAVLATLDGFVRTQEGSALAAAHRDLRSVLRASHGRRHVRKTVAAPPKVVTAGLVKASEGVMGTAHSERSGPFSRSGQRASNGEHIVRAVATALPSHHLASVDARTRAIRPEPVVRHHAPRENQRSAFCASCSFSWSYRAFR